MYRLLFIITLLILCISCFSQSKKLNHTSSLKINLTDFINSFSFISFDMSFEKKISKRMSIQTELGIPIYRFNLQGYYSTNVDTSFGRNQGVKSNIEIRHYRLKENADKNTNLYLAMNFSFALYQTNIKIDYSVDSLTTNQDCFYMKRNEFGITPITGFKTSHKRLTLEMFIGLGFINNQIRNQFREYNNVSNKLTNQRHNIFGIGDTNFSEHSGWRIIPRTGIRFGFYLDSKKK